MGPIFTSPILVHHAECVTDLHLVEPEDPDIDAVALVASLPNLRHIEFSGGEAESFLDEDLHIFDQDDPDLVALKAAMSSVRSLKFQAEVPAMTATAILSLTSRLERLDVSGSTIGETNGAVIGLAASFQQHLVDFTVDLIGAHDRSESYTPRSVPNLWLDLPWASQLQRLALCTVALGPDDLAFVGLFAPTLERLEIHANYAATPFRVSVGVGFPHLTTVILHGGLDHSVDAAMDTDLNRLLLHLSGSPLEHLTYKSKSISYTTAYPALIKTLSSHFPTLRVLALSALGIYGDLPLTPDAFDAISSYCKTKRIDLRDAFTTDGFSHPRLRLDPATATASSLERERGIVAEQAIRALEWGIEVVRRGDVEGDTDAARLIAQLALPLEAQREGPLSSVLWTSHALQAGTSRGETKPPTAPKTQPTR